jgi:hypothetical protein
MTGVSAIRVHAGDFKIGSNHFFVTDGRLLMAVPGRWFRTWIPISEVSTLERASEESVKRVGGSLGWGIAGGALLGPIGLLAGLLAGGQATDVTFVCTFKDGRKFLGTIDSKAYTKMSAALFK